MGVCNHILSQNNASNHQHKSLQNCLRMDAIEIGVLMTRDHHLKIRVITLDNEYFDKINEFCTLPGWGTITRVYLTHIYVWNISQSTLPLTYLLLGWSLTWPNTRESAIQRYNVVQSSLPLGRMIIRLSRFSKRYLWVRRNSREWYRKWEYASVVWWEIVRKQSLAFGQVYFLLCISSVNDGGGIPDSSKHQKFSIWFSI